MKALSPLPGGSQRHALISLLSLIRWLPCMCPVATAPRMRCWISSKQPCSASSPSGWPAAQSDFNGVRSATARPSISINRSDHFLVAGAEMLSTSFCALNVFGWSFPSTFKRPAKARSAKARASAVFFSACRHGPHQCLIHLLCLRILVRTHQSLHSLLRRVSGLCAGTAGSHQKKGEKRLHGAMVAVSMSGRNVAYKTKMVSGPHLRAKMPPLIILSGHRNKCCQASGT